MIRANKLLKLNAELQIHNGECEQTRLDMRLRCGRKPAGLLCGGRYTPDSQGPHVIEDQLYVTLQCVKCTYVTLLNLNFN